MISIGLTGGIGSGKTLVCEVFKKLQIPVFNADERAKELINCSEIIKNKLLELYGDKIYTSNSIINSSLLAEIIFNDKHELEKVNSIVHPEVFKSIKEFQALNVTFPYIIIEAAILFESNANLLTDKIIVVSAPEKMRIERVIARDNVNRSTVISRIRNQISDKEKMEKADYIIYNDGRMLLNQIIEIHNTLK